MPCEQTDIDRIVELYNLINNNKSHEFAAPTYKDSPYLREMAEITERWSDDDADVLEEKIPVLWFLTECYDSMCRAGISVKYYKMQLEAHVKLMKLKAYTADETEHLESCFYLAVKTRNYFEPDDCADLCEIVFGSVSEDKMQELLVSAQKNRREFIKIDPVEKTEKYLAVIDEVEQKVDENKTMDFCLEHWNLKAAYLAEHGIRWRSPAQLNPRVKFD